MSQRAASTSPGPADASPSTIGLIGGEGRMGRMFRRLFEASGHQVTVSGPGTGLSNERLVELVEVVIVAVPVKGTVDVIRSIAPRMAPGQLLSDFTSIKHEPVEAMLASPASVIGCHPIFGPMANVKGQNVVLCPARPGPFLAWYRGFLEGHGMKVTELTPEAHDRSMAFIQGLTHFLNITFARTLQTQQADLEQLLQVCSPVYRILFSMLCRILSGDPALYGQIQITNRENLPVVRDFLANGEDFLRGVERQDWDGVNLLIEEAGNSLGDFKQTAREESDFLIDQMRRLLERGGAEGKGKTEQ